MNHREECFVEMVKREAKPLDVELTWRRNIYTLTASSPTAVLIRVEARGFVRLHKKFLEEFSKVQAAGMLRGVTSASEISAPAN
jgi:hypothetical protein